MGEAYLYRNILVGIWQPIFIFRVGRVFNKVTSCDFWISQVISAVFLHFEIFLFLLHRLSEKKGDSGVKAL